MDHKISMKKLKGIDSVSIEDYYNVYDWFTLKHYCTMNRSILGKRYLSYEKAMGRRTGLRSLKYILCKPSLAFRRIYRPDKKLTMGLLKRRKRDTGLKIQVWSDIW